MTIPEAHAWSLAASPAAVQSVRDAAGLARCEWIIRLARPQELRDLGPWARGGWFSPQGAVNAAAEIMVELMIIVALWPDGPCVLRPSWE